MQRIKTIPIPVLVLLVSTCQALACVEDEPEGDADAWADRVVAFEPAADSDFGHDGLPDVVLGPPGGTLDVASLGCGGSIVLGFDGVGIVDGDGPDLIVFENAFAESFPEPGEVAVSDDGERWWTFPCEPTTLDGCAGVHPTADLDAGVDWRDAAVAGGDAFDLAALDGAPSQVYYVRIRDRSQEYWAPLGQDWCDPGQQGAGGFDLDAIIAIHG